MSNTTSIYLYVNGAYVPYNAQYEYTSGGVTNAWGSAISPFISIVNGVSQDGTPPALTSTDVSNVQNAIEQLVSLAQSGVTTTDTSGGNSVTRTSYLTYTMATDLNQLLISLQNAGITVTPNFTYLKNTNGSYVLDANGNPVIDPASVNSRGNLYTANNVTLQNLTVWRDLAASTPIVQQILKSAQTEAQTGTRSLQSLVELEYVSAGNEIITKQLQGLQDQLTLTKQVLDTLTNLQNLHNDIVINGKSAFSNIFKYSLGRPATLPNLTISYNVNVIYPNNYPVASLRGKYVSLWDPNRKAIESGLPIGVREYLNTGIISGFSNPRTGVTPQLTIAGQIVTFPSLYSTTIPNSFIEDIAAGKFASQGIPAMGLPSARIVAFAGIPNNVGSNRFQGFVTVSKVYAKLPAFLQTFYKDHQNALIAVDNVPVSGLKYDQGDIDAPGDINTTTRPSAGNINAVVNATYEAIYGKYASAYFGQPIVPALPSSIIYNEANFQTAKNQLVTYRNNLVSAIATLTANATSAQIADQNSLLNQLKVVLKDINETFVTPSGKPIQADTGYLDAFTGFRDWMMDNYQHYVDPSAANAGLYQQHITNAITAGSATNDDQKQKVQNAIYIFQEFYKSASSVLQALTQIITKIAQNIAR